VGDVQVVNPLGQVGHVPEHQLEGALDEGYTLATPEQVREQALQERFGGTAQGVAAAGIGVAHGATMGLSTAAAAQLGGEGTRDYLKNIREIQSGAFIGGEVIGSVVGAGKIGAPANLAARAGKAVAGRLAAKGVTSKTLQYGAAAAAEGALYGVGEGLAQASIDNELNGEKFAATLLGSTVAGGVLGGGIGAAAGAFGKLRNALGRTLQRPGSAAYQRVAEKAVGDGAQPGLGRKIGNMLGDGAALLGKPRDAARKLLALDNEGAALRRTAMEGAANKAAATEDLVKLIDGIEQPWDEVVRVIREAPLKRASVAQVVKKGNESAQARAFQSQVGRIAEQLDGMITAGRGKIRQGGLKDIRGVLEDFTKQADEIVGRGGDDIAEHLYSTLDRIKREVGHHVASAARTKGLVKNQRQFKALNGIYHGLRDGLEDVGLWGGAAEMQRAINAPITKLLGVQSKYSQKFLTKFGKSKINPWRPAFVADADKVASYVNTLLDPRKDITHRALVGSLTHRRDAARAMLQHADLSATQRAGVQQIETNSAKMLKRIDKAAQDISAANMLESLEGAGEGALGGLIGGAVGSGNLAALAVAPLLNPARAVRALAAVEGMAGKLNLRMDSGVKGLFGTIGDAVPAVKRAAKGAALGIPRAGAAAARGLQRHVDSRERYKAQSDRVRDLAARSADLDAELQEELAMLSNRAPTVHAQALATQKRALDYLVANMPGVASPHPFGIAPSVSATDAEQWLRRARAVEDPMTLLDDMQDGALSREAVDAVKNVYPAMFAELQGKVLERVTGLDAAGKRPPYEQRKQLGVLLDIQTDVTLDPLLIAQMQAGYQQQGEQKGPGQARSRSSKPVKSMSAAYKSGSAELEESTL